MDTTKCTPASVATFRCSMGKLSTTLMYMIWLLRGLFKPWSFDFGFVDLGLH